MELQNYINSHPNYISEFRNLNFKINSYKKFKNIFPDVELLEVKKKD